MKTFLWAALAFCALPALSQTIHIANNNPGAVTGTNVFVGNTAFADAIAAAVSGDIIYVVPSGSTYGAVNVDKPLTIFGAGFNPDKTNSVTSKCQNITIAADNVRLSGLVVGPMVQVQAGFTNAMIDKCRINRISLGSNVGNVIIQNCVVGENTSGQNSIYGFDLTNAGVRIVNNLIYGTSPSGYLNYLNNATIENNVFVGHASSPGNEAFNIVQNSNIKNNIFHGVEPQGSNTLNFLSNTQQFNLSYGATDNTFVNTTGGNTASNNIEGTDDPQFENLPLVTPGLYYDESYNPALKAGSAALGAGEGGTDMGVFGGATPFDLSGTSLPTVQTVTAPATVTQGTDMNVRVQGKGN